jgi:uncharacterized protein YndB with AHSA1/START domain
VIVEFEQVVDRPVAQVFSLMADVGSRPEWVALALERTALDEDAAGAGSRYRARDRYLLFRPEFVHEITELEPDRLLVEQWDGPLGGSMTTRFFEEDGSTRVVLRMVMTPPAALRLVAPLAKGWLVRGLRKDFARFEELVDVTAH